MMNIMDNRVIKNDGLAFKILEEILYIGFVLIGFIWPFY